MNTSKPVPPLPSESGEHELLEWEASGGGEHEDEDEDEEAGVVVLDQVRYNIVGFHSVGECIIVRTLSSPYIRRWQLTQTARCSLKLPVVGAPLGSCIAAGA
jgi:hypothetical protein